MSISLHMWLMTSAVYFWRLVNISIIAEEQGSCVCVCRWVGLMMSVREEDFTGALRHRDIGGLTHAGVTRLPPA